MNAKTNSAKAAEGLAHAAQYRERGFTVEKYGREEAIRRYREGLVGKDLSELRAKISPVIAVLTKPAMLTCC